MNAHLAHQSMGPAGEEYWYFSQMQTLQQGSHAGMGNDDVG
jgi:hypothetical protein